MSNKLVNELNTNPSESYSRSGSGVCMNPKFKKSSSLQASAIEKARDLIDNEDEAEEGTNVSLDFAVINARLHLDCFNLTSRPSLIP